MGKSLRKKTFSITGTPTRIINVDNLNRDSIIVISIVHSSD